MKTILIADDLFSVRELVIMTLGSPGNRFIEAADGDAAWAALQAEPFDLVILDVMMPRRNGFDVAQAIRADPALAGLKIVMLTGFGDKGREIGEAIGVDAYLDKPFSPLQLIGVVEAALVEDPTDALRFPPGR